MTSVCTAKKHSLCRAKHFDELPLSEQPISTHVATRSPSSASTQVFLPTTTPSCNCNTDTAPPQCHHRRGRHGEGRVQAAADRAAPTPSPTALPASRPSQVGQPAEDAPLTASQAAPGPLTAMRAAPPPLPERPSDLLPLAAARPGQMGGAFHGRARRIHGASARSAVHFTSTPVRCDNGRIPHQIRQRRRPGPSQCRGRWRRQQQVPRASATRHVNGHARNTTPSSEQGNHRALNVNGVLNRPPQSKPEDRGNAFESRVARSSARSAASAETEAPPLGGSQCGRREPMGVTTWETSFVVYT